jgi:hypothetical protein
VAVEAGDALDIVNATGPEELFSTGVAGTAGFRLPLLAQTINAGMVLDDVRVL